ncbi:MAG: archease [Candidatus Nealsonbacteria bacterium]|nr:archease [Candidatus Nealsonbacteria bacterium]
MKRYEILEHKADLKIKVKGSSKEELFLNALLGMEEGLRPETKETKEEIKREIKIKSIDLPALLVDFLNEALYLIQVHKEIYNKIKFVKFSENEGEEDKSSSLLFAARVGEENKSFSSPFNTARELEGELIGQKVERFGEDIKAVTYHDLDIYQKEDGTWEAVVLFDI